MVEVGDKYKTLLGSIFEVMAVGKTHAIICYCDDKGESTWTMKAIESTCTKIENEKTLEETFQVKSSANMITFSFETYEDALTFIKTHSVGITDYTITKKYRVTK